MAYECHCQYNHVRSVYPQWIHMSRTEDRMGRRKKWIEFVTHTWVRFLDEFDSLLCSVWGFARFFLHLFPQRRSHMHRNCKPCSWDVSFNTAPYGFLFHVSLRLYIFFSTLHSILAPKNLFHFVVNETKWMSVQQQQQKNDVISRRARRMRIPRSSSFVHNLAGFCCWRIRLFFCSAPLFRCCVCIVIK